MLTEPEENRKWKLFGLLLWERLTINLRTVLAHALTFAFRSWRAGALEFHWNLTSRCAATHARGKGMRKRTCLEPCQKRKKRNGFERSDAGKEGRREKRRARGDDPREGTCFAIAHGARPVPGIIGKVISYARARRKRNYVCGARMYLMPGPGLSARPTTTLGRLKVMDRVKQREERPWQCISHTF